MAANGVSADIISDPNASVNRMNIGRLHEQFINAASKDLEFELQRTLGGVLTEDELRPMRESNDPRWVQAWTRLMRYYEINSPRFHNLFASGQYKSPPERHMAKALTGTVLWIPTDNEPEYMEIINQLIAEYMPTYGPVTYIGASGRPVTTESPVLLGRMYYLFLEKIGDTASAVASAKLQHFGIISTINDRDKHTTPNRPQAIRAIGEAELRNMMSYGPPGTAAEIMSRNNDALTHRTVCDSILNAEQPSNIVTVTGRHELGTTDGARPLQIIKHLLYCSGVVFRYRKFDENEGVLT